VIVHGITPGETRESPDIRDVLPEFEAFCAESILVGHAVSIDLEFLAEEAGRHGIPPIASPAVDTMALHRFVCRRTEERCAFHDKEPGPMDLYTLARERGIPVNRPHDALSDAYLTAQLFQQFLAALPAHGVRTVGELLEIGQP
jgi:DNA polymerase-3 subunit epsilon